MPPFCKVFLEKLIITSLVKKTLCLLLKMIYSFRSPGLSNSKQLHIPTCLGVPRAKFIEMQTAQLLTYGCLVPLRHRCTLKSLCYFTPQLSLLTTLIRTLSKQNKLPCTTQTSFIKLYEILDLSYLIQLSHYLMTTIKGTIYKRKILNRLIRLMLMKF